MRLTFQRVHCVLASFQRVLTAFHCVLTTENPVHLRHFALFRRVLFGQPRQTLFDYNGLGFQFGESLD